MSYSTASCGCPDGQSRCIMAAIITFNPPTRWSQCSIDDLNTGFTGPRNLDRCLFNEPTTVVGDLSCGNGIQDEGEDCDCGSPQVGPRLHNKHCSLITFTLKAATLCFYIRATCTCILHMCIHPHSASVCEVCFRCHILNINTLPYNVMYMHSYRSAKIPAVMPIPVDWP